MKNVIERRILVQINLLIAGLAFMMGSINPVQANHKPEEKTKGRTKEGIQIYPALIVPEHVSPLSRFKKYREIDKQGWKESNNIVGEIGGWRIYAKKAYEAEESERKIESSGENGENNEKL